MSFALTIIPLLIQCIRGQMYIFDVPPTAVVEQTNDNIELRVSRNSQNEIIYEVKNEQTGQWMQTGDGQPSSGVNSVNLYKPSTQDFIPQANPMPAANNVTPQNYVPVPSQPNTNPQTQAFIPVVAPSAREIQGSTPTTGATEVPPKGESTSTKDKTKTEEKDKTKNGKSKSEEKTSSSSKTKTKNSAASIPALFFTASALLIALIL